MLQPALKQAPEDSALMALAGELYMQSNELAKATQFFEKAVKFDPTSASARAKLGVSRLALGETDRALADLESAVQLDSNKYQADITLVMSYLYTGYPEDIVLGKYLKVTGEQIKDVANRYLDRGKLLTTVMLPAETESMKNPGKEPPPANAALVRAESSVRE